MEYGGCGQVGRLLVTSVTRHAHTSSNLEQGSAIIQNQMILVKHVQSMDHPRMKYETFLMSRNFALASSLKQTQTESSDNH